MRIESIPQRILRSIRRGVVIPAMPLALDASRKLNARRQRALARYYVDAGAGGIAVGVHSAQFEIRDPDVALFEPVLELVSHAIDEHCARRDRLILKVAGICGTTPQAAREAEFARGAGYHAGMISLGAMANADIPALIAHCREVAAIMPVIGFYLQPAGGGRVLPYAFWRAFADLRNVLAIKIAPFNRYQTLDVVRAVCNAGRQEEIALYTGNDDNIVIDLLTPFRVPTPAGLATARIAGGLLGQWAVWTKRAAELLEEIHKTREKEAAIPRQMLTRAAEVTDANGAIFDPANNFAGCIPGIHEVLRRQGLLEGTWCLNPSATLSPGQMAEIERVCAQYPHLTDDAFVQKHLEEWLAD